MSAGQIVYERLVGDAGVAAVVGTRVLPLLAVLDTELPCVVYQVGIDDEGEGTAPVQRCTVTVNCLAHDEEQAHDAAVAVDAALNGYSGAAGGVRLSALVRGGSQDEYDEEINVWRRTLTFYGVQIG